MASRESKTDTSAVGRKKDANRTTTFGDGTSLKGVLRFKDPLCIRGTFSGTIDAQGPLVVEAGAVVEVNRLSVTALSVSGTVRGSVFAVDSVEMLPGSVVSGDVSAARMKIADGVLFEGRCSMTGIEDDVEIFSRPTAEIKKQLQKDAAKGTV